MNENNVLPVDFDGVFRFTNFTDADFKARWNKIEYTFPAMKTTPIIIPGATPEEVQNIRKKFAKELAESEFYKTDKFKRLDDKINGANPATYTESDLAPFIQKCLEPLPVGSVTATAIPKDSKDRYSANTNVLDKADLEQRKSLMRDDSAPINA